MPFGLCNAPATFQHLMQNCLGELNLSFAMVYLDDMIVYSETPEDHLTWLQAVFDCFTWEVLNQFDSEAVALVSGAAETVDYFG